MATMQRQLGDHLPRWSHFMYDVELVELNFTNRLSMVEPLLNPCFCVCFGSEFLVMPAVFRSLEMNIFMHVRCYFDWHHMNLKSPASDTLRSSGCET